MENSLFKFIFVAILAAGISILGTTIYFRKSGTAIPGTISAQEAAKKALDFINENFPQANLSLVNVVEERGLYKLRLKSGDQEFISYVTKDGKLLFPQEGINLDEKLPSPVVTEPSPAAGPSEKEYPLEKLESLAKCLNEKGVKFYGTPNCPWCIRQKEIFGQAAQYLPYIDCTQKREECEKANVGGVPDWRFPDGTQKVGFQPIEQLAELSGCPL